MNVENAYDRWAESYDTMANKTRDLDLFASARNLGHLSFQSILEVGCGTGKNTEWLCHQCSKLIAVDFSETMMALARQKVTSKNVEWRKFDISRSWPIEGISFDLITFNLVLEHVHDLSFVFAESACRLAKGGVIHLSELHPFKQYLGSKARFESENEMHELEVFTHHLSDFTMALSDAGLKINDIKEWFDSDRKGVPRLLTIIAVSDR